MKTYYIEFERQGWTLAVVKVEADTYEEAVYKALLALHDNDDISPIPAEMARKRLEDGDIDWIVGEDGNEISLDEIN